MNKLVCGILTVILCLSAVGALAQESDMPEVRWTYPVSLTEIQSKYAMLVNADNMLEKDFEPDPLVKVTGVKRATSAAVYLEETAAKALTEMFNAAAAVTEYVYVNENGKEKTATYDEETGMVLYLKSGYRSYGTQSTTYANYLARNNNVDDGYVAKPGSSEHQTGILRRYPQRGLRWPPHHDAGFQMDTRSPVDEGKLRYLRLYPAFPGGKGGCDRDQV